MIDCCYAVANNTRTTNIKDNSQSKTKNVIYDASADYLENSLRIDSFSFSDIHLLQKHISVGKSI